MIKMVGHVSKRERIGIEYCCKTKNSPNPINKTPINVLDCFKKPLPKRFSCCNSSVMIGYYMELKSF